MSASELKQTVRILVIDDDASMRSLITDVLEGEGYVVQSASDGTQGIQMLQSQTYDLILSDLRMPGADGMEVLKACQAKAASASIDPTPPVHTQMILLTAFGTIAGAVEAMKLGAFDYITKPLENIQVLRAVVQRALAARNTGLSDQCGARAAGKGRGGGVKGEARKGGGGSGSEPGNESMAGADGLIWNDPASQRLLQTIKVVAGKDISVLLLGESGVGKEVVAKLMHRMSPRHQAPFVAVNCAAIPDNLFEAEFFGHERGAFTGAHAARKGYFEEAHGGTLLLDEVGELPLALQAKLLRAIEERRIVRVGSTQPKSVDVRIVAATNQDLYQAVLEGRFRQDLYYRLGVFPLTIPALRDRPADIVQMAEAFLGQNSASDEGRRGRLTEGARRKLVSHNWPGNIRELRNVMERSSILSGGKLVDEEDLLLCEEGARDIMGDKAGHQGAAALPGGANADMGSLKDMERKTIMEALEACNGNRKEAAMRLGIGLRTLQYKLKEYGLTRRSQ